MDIVKLAETMAAATPGPWAVGVEKSHTIDVVHNDHRPGAITGTLVTVSLGKVSSRKTWRGEGFANAALMAMSRELGAEVLRLSALVDDLTAAIARQKDGGNG